MFILGIKLSYAVRTDAMTKLRIGMFGDIPFDLVPVTLVITDFFAGRTNRQESAQSLYVIEGILQPGNQLILFPVLFPDPSFEHNGFGTTLHCRKEDVH